jgi:diadenosine tetraphosphate (Ap4A) HIT family hydrolase
MKEKCHCIDCKIYRGEHIPVGGIIYQDSVWVLNHADPKVLGHLILKPIKHYKSISDIPDNVAKTIGPLFKRINHAIEHVCKPEKIYIAAFGDAFPYLHWHFFPRYKNMPTPASAALSEFDKGLYSCSIDEVKKVAKAIRKILKSG